MFKDVRHYVRFLTACTLLAVIILPIGLVAQSHIVSPADMQKEMVAATQTRERNLETVRKFLSSPAAEKDMKAAHMNPEQVKVAVASLSDQELAQLAVRADKAQADFAAGQLSNRDLIYITLGIAVLILVIVAVR